MGKDKDSPSPKLKIKKSPRRECLCSRREKFEGRYKGKNVKELTKYNLKEKKFQRSRQKSPKEKKDPFTQMMERMEENFKDIKEQIRYSNIKVDKLGEKIERIEKAKKKNEKEQKKEFETIRKEMQESKTLIEENVTKAVVETLKRKITNIQSQVNLELEKLKSHVNDEIEKLKKQ